MAKLTLFEKLDRIEARYDEMSQQLSSPEAHDDSGRYQKLAKAHAELGEIVSKYREWKEINNGLQGARQLFAEAEDPEMKQLAQEEQRELEARLEPVGRLERPAVDPDLLAEQEDALVARHLFAERLANRLEISSLPRGLRRRRHLGDRIAHSALTSSGE